MFRSSWIASNSMCSRSEQATRLFTVRGGTFVAAIERIFLSYGDRGDGDKLPAHSDDTPMEFEPQIARK
jgi:hypothetical protein